MPHICILLRLLYHFFITILIFFLFPPEHVENKLNHRAAWALVCHRKSPINNGFLCSHHITVTPLKYNIDSVTSDTWPFFLSFMFHLSCDCSEESFIGFGLLSFHPVLWRNCCPFVFVVLCGAKAWTQDLPTHILKNHFWCSNKVSHFPEVPPIPPA